MAKNVRKRGRPAQNQSPLSAELIILSARNLMQENAKVPSIRQISSRLDVDPMAIYHYFSSKSALLEALTVSLIEDIYEPQEVDLWQGELEALCKSYLELLRQYSGLLETLLSMKAFGPSQVFNQRLAIALAPLQLSETVFVQARDLIVDYIHGVALAAQCHSEGLPTECIDGPLSFICSGLVNR